MQDKIYDVVGLGSCALDYITNVRSFSDKDNKVTSHNHIALGGGVTANNLTQTARLGLKTLWCGVLGKDNEASILLQEFNQDNVIVVAQELDKTQFTWIAVDKTGEKQIYVFPNAANKLTPEIVETKFKQQIQQAKHFHTEIAVIPLAAAIKGAEIATQANTKVLIDVDGDIEHLLNHANIGTREEIQQLLDLADVIKLSKAASLQLAEGKDIQEFIKTYTENKANKIVVITLGDQGSYIATQNETIFSPAYKINCVDGTGAGDAFMGGLSYALLQNYSLHETIHFASACGAFACTKLGARTSGNLQQIRELQHSSPQTN